MKKNDFIRPDEAALHRVLQQNKNLAAELIIRLAWQAGLTRKQIHDLTWEQVSFHDAMILFSGRLPISICPELLDCLQRRFRIQGEGEWEYVVLTDRCKRVHETRIARIAGDALNKEEALKGLSIADLRNDFIIRALEQHGKGYAMQMSGISLDTLYTTFRQYIPKGTKSAGGERPPKAEEIDEKQLLNFLYSEGASMPAAAVWLRWKQGMTLEDMASLTWEQVDFKNGVIHLANTESRMCQDVIAVLQELFINRSDNSDPHVLLSPKTKKAVRYNQVAFIVRESLYRHGIDFLHLNALACFEDVQDMEKKIMRYLRENHSITRNEAVDLVKKSDVIVYRKLKYLVKSGRLVSVGRRYYLPGTVVPADQHEEIIREYLKNNVSVTRDDITKLLKIEPRACAWILRKMVDQGLIIRQGKYYFWQGRKEDF